MNGYEPDLVKCLHFPNALKSVTDADKICMLVIQDIVNCEWLIVNFGLSRAVMHL